MGRNFSHNITIFTILMVTDHHFAKKPEGFMKLFSNFIVS